MTLTERYRRYHRNPNRSLAVDLCWFPGALIVVCILLAIFKP